MFYYALTHIRHTGRYKHVRTYTHSNDTYIYLHTYTLKVCVAAFCTIIITQQLDLNTCASLRCSGLAKADPSGSWAGALLEDWPCLMESTPMVLPKPQLHKWDLNHISKTWSSLAFTSLANAMYSLTQLGVDWNNANNILCSTKQQWHLVGIKPEISWLPG